jgi:hypothetical protein
MGIGAFLSTVAKKVSENKLVKGVSDVKKVVGDVGGSWGGGAPSTSGGSKMKDMGGYFLKDPTQDGGFYGHYEVKGTKKDSSGFAKL